MATSMARYCQIQDMLSQMRSDIPPPHFDTAANLKSKLVARTDRILRPGVLAPDFTLLGPGGVETRLRDLLVDGPVVISFYRGGWCPYCSLELQALQDELENINALGAQLIAVSPEISCWSLESRWKSNVSFKVLTDPENAVAKEFGVYCEVDKTTRDYFKAYFQTDLDRWHNSSSAWGLPYPGTFIVDQRGVIRYSWIDGDITKRVEPEEIVTVLKEVVADR